MFNKLIIAVLPVFPKSFVKIFAKKYVAGDFLSDAVRVVKELNAKNVVATIDVLGEDVNTKEEALSSLEECKEVLETIKKFNLQANLSVKLTQIGLQIDEEFCYQNVKSLVELAGNLNNFIRIDMEDSSVTDITLRVFSRLRKEYDNVGIVVQAYLKRTKSDVENLMKLGSTFRLCKGIYVEPEAIAIKDHDAINKNYLEILDMMLNNKSYMGIATHDDFLVTSAKKMIKDRNLKNDEYEFQMLLGVKPDLRDRLVKEGHKVRIYVPFGIHWYKYSTRRLKENPKMAGYIVKSIFFRG
jgi:proline dehydrogenase